MALSDDKKPKQRSKRKRWGTTTSHTNEKQHATGAPSEISNDTTSTTTKLQALQASVQARLAAAKANSAPSSSQQKIQTLQLSVKERLEAAKRAKKRASSDTTTSNTATALPAKKQKRAKVYDLDLSVTAPTHETVVPKTTQPTKPPSNPYLAHNDHNDDNDNETMFDERLGVSQKTRHARKTFAFVEPGTYQAKAEHLRLKAKAVEQSGLLSGRKAGHTIHALPSLTEAFGESILDDRPRAEAHPDTTMPLVLEWWDVELLPINLKQTVADQESQALLKRTTKQQSSSLSSASDKKDKDGSSTVPTVNLEELRTECWKAASLEHAKTSSLVQHIVPIRPPNAPKSTPQPTLFLTEKERKRQRKLRRQQKVQEQQDLQAAGLAPAPEPRLTLSNFIRVLGDQAVLDPSQMEQKVTQQMQARQQAHLERNAANQLTKEQRSEKRARKFQEDLSQRVSVAIFYVANMSHPYHRAKVDLNAQQYNLTGVCLECQQDPKFALIIVEGGPKAIKKYVRLLTVRMKWSEPPQQPPDDDNNDDDTERPQFDPNNKCEMVWSGLGLKRLFHGFLFQTAETHSQARKLLKSKGGEHYWDQAWQHAKGSYNTLGLKLVEDGDEDEHGNDDKEDTTMDTST